MSEHAAHEKANENKKATASAVNGTVPAVATNGTTEKAKLDLDTPASSKAEGDKPKLSKEEMRKLFTEFDTATSNEAACLDALEDARKAKSEVVRKIVEGIGGNGPFEWKGKRFHATRRGDKFFFKTENGKAINVG
jgi:hypothetical protein